MSRCEGCDCGEDCACESSTCDDCGYRLYECECAECYPPEDDEADECPTVWSGAQWAVTECGIVGLGARWKHHWIDAADLSDLSTETEHQGLLSWPVHMAEKGEVDLEDFLAAFKVALLHHDALISQSLTASITKARRVRFEMQFAQRLQDIIRPVLGADGDHGNVPMGLIAMCAHLAACLTDASAA